MSNSNEYERLWKVQAMVNKLVLDGKCDPQSVADKLQEIVDCTDTGQCLQVSRGHVKLISGAEKLTLDPTDGKETITWAKDVFTGGIDSSFESYGTDVPSLATKKMKVTVHEIIKDGTFVEIFGGMSKDLNSLCFTQAQIIQFVRIHRKWLRSGGYATFFLFKVGEVFFVAGVHFRGGGRRRVRVDCFPCYYVWDAEDAPRIVVPQLISES